MKWDWELTKKAEKSLTRFDQTTVGRIFDALDRLTRELTANTPTPTNVKKLTGPDEIWRLRVGNHRILFTREAKVVEGKEIGVALVHNVGHRREIYRVTSYLPRTRGDRPWPRLDAFARVQRNRVPYTVTTSLSAAFILSCAVQGQQMPAPTSSYPSVAAIKSPPAPIPAVTDPVASGPSPDPFSSRQSDEDLKLITSDARVHPIRILFWDTFKIRVAKDAEFVRADNKFGFVQLIQEKSVLQDLASVLSQYTLAYIINPAADSLSEEELNRKEVEEEGMTGSDVPNDGSWAEISIEGYTDEKIIRLYKQLQSKHYIRGIQVVGTPP